MRRVLPRSLSGQMALLLGLALLVAQLINFGLILGDRQKLSLAQTEGPAIARFVVAASAYADAPDEFLRPVGRGRGRRFHIRVSSLELVDKDSVRDTDIERRLRQSLSEAGVRTVQVRAAIGIGIHDQRGGRGVGKPANTTQRLFLSAQYSSGEWINASFVTQRRDPWLAARLAAATMLLYLIVLGASLVIAARLARPLRDLTEAAEQFGGRGDPKSVEPRGPDDLRRAIMAFNAMNRRVVTLLDEKDRMLGAIGHDLRTPLASMRIRVENMEPVEERMRLAATVDEMTVTLEDILVLARTGRTRELARQVDLAALVDTVVEEARLLGRDVVLESSGRLVATVRPDLIRRGLRNLVDNAVIYGGSARVTLVKKGGFAIIEVSDRGPGLPPDEIERVLEPFYRVEASRSRETGGSGLGLAIARAAAETHGGTLRLRNRPGGGLVAAMTLPLQLKQVKPA